jgi:hypothetical protein
MGSVHLLGKSVVLIAAVLAWGALGFFVGSYVVGSGPPAPPHTSMHLAPAQPIELGGVATQSKACSCPGPSSPLEN